MLAGAAKFFVDGGAFMWPIAITSVFGVAIMVERVIFLFFKYNINANQFMAQIQKLVMANNIDRAIKLHGSKRKAATALGVDIGTISRKTSNSNEHNEDGINPPHKQTSTWS